MTALVLEHVLVADLPLAWREKLALPTDAYVTVRFESEEARQVVGAADDLVTDDPALGIWRDRVDMGDVACHVQRVRVGFKQEMESSD